MAGFAPWLVIRDNTWLTISIVCTAALVAGIATIASSTSQSFFHLSISAMLRRVDTGVTASVGTGGQVASVARGVVFAIPVVGVFWLLLASADDVFASVVNPETVPVARIVLFVLLVPILVAGVWAATNRRPTRDASPSSIARFFGTIEVSIVLSAVSALFFVFVALRLATLGRELDEATWREEVRSGFFQLLWVAALTVLLVLAIRHVAGRALVTGRIRRLSWLTIALAAAIDGLALLRIAQYVEQSFLSPLRFWSFGFGLWLLVVLAMTAVRVADIGGERNWFVGAALTSWALFLFALAVLNPDARIAQHNFDNAPTGQDQWIAVQPLMWLSEDATPIIVDNIEVLRPMPNNRYERTVEHLCTRDLEGSWRELHISRAAARDAIVDLC